MKIIYLCPTGLHTAMAAAGVHLGRLPAEEIPAAEDIINLSREYRRTGYMLGKPVFIGRDAAGNDVFTVGVAGAHDLMKKAVEDLLEKVYDFKRQDYMVVDIATQVNLWIKLGSFLSMRLNLGSAGERLCAYGIKKKYRDISGKVQKVKVHTT